MQETHYLSREFLLIDIDPKSDQIQGYKQRVKDAISAELKLPAYDGMTNEEKLKALCDDRIENDQNIGNRYSEIVMGIPYAANTIGLNEIENL